MIGFSVDKDACIGCGACVRDCLPGVLHLDGGVPAMRDEGRCMRCQHCLAVCPTGAIALMGNRAEGSTPLEGAFPGAGQLETLFKGRRSVRQYRQRNVDPALIREVLESAAHAPTGGNAQRLLVTVVDDIAVMNAFREAVYRRLGELAEGDAMPDHPRRAFFMSVAQRWKDGHDDIFRTAPHCVVVSNAGDATCVEQDPLIYLSYYELMAQARGLGTVWCGLLYWCLRDMLPEFLPRLGIPETHRIGYAMLFGYPAATYRRTVENRRAEIQSAAW